MFFGIDMEKIVIIAVVAALLLGPERLPRYAELLGKFTVRARDWLNGARSRVRDEMGEDFDEIEWRKLDPRQYDPRRIIRDALLDDAPVRPPAATATGAAATAATGASVAGSTTVAAVSAPVTFTPGAPVPYDTEAT